MMKRIPFAPAFLLLGLLAIGCSSGPSAGEQAGPDSALSTQTVSNPLSALDVNETQADRAIAQRVRKALAQDTSLSADARGVRIRVMDGVTLLRGQVSDQAERSAVVARAAQIEGVAGVEDQLSTR